MTIDTRRQRLLVREPHRQSALIVGAGSTGSTAALLLARTGIGKITLMDDDELNEWNVAGGVFDRTFMGKPKVRSVRSLIKRATGSVIDIVESKYYGQPVGSHSIIVVGTDSMESRIEIFKNMRDVDHQYYIDGRMGGHVCECFCIPNKNTDAERDYIATMQVKVADMPCGTEATAYVIERLSSMIGRCVRSICNDDKPPFRQYWDAEADQELTFAF